MAVVHHRGRGNRGQHRPGPSRTETRTRSGDSPLEESTMTPARKRRLYWVLGILAGVGVAAALALSAFQKNVMFFFDPTQVAAGEVKQGQRFRLGGMVSK